MSATRKKYSDEENIKILKEEIEALNGSSSALFEVRKRCAKDAISILAICFGIFAVIGILFGLFFLCISNDFFAGLFIGALLFILLAAWEFLEILFPLYGSGDIGASLFIAIIAYLITESSFPKNIVVFITIVSFLVPLMLIRKSSLNKYIDERRTELIKFGVKCDIINGKIIYKELFADYYDINKIIDNWTTIINSIENPLKTYLRIAFPSYGNENYLILSIAEGIASDYFTLHKENIGKLETIFSDYIGKQVKIDIKII